MDKNYKEFLEKKIVVAGTYGSEIDKSKINEIALPHQKDIIHWAISGGRRAIFASLILIIMMMVYFTLNLLNIKSTYLYCLIF